MYSGHFTGLFSISISGEKIMREGRGKYFCYFAALKVSLHWIVTLLITRIIHTPIIFFKEFF